MERVHLVDLAVWRNGAEILRQREIANRGNPDGMEGSAFAEEDSMRMGLRTIARSKLPTSASSMMFGVSPAGA